MSAANSGPRGTASFPVTAVLRGVAALSHVPVILSVLQRKLEWQGPRLLMFVLCGTLLLAALSWHLLEKPAMERVKRA